MEINRIAAINGGGEEGEARENIYVQAFES
jgi:hypothetical protein